MNGSLLSSFFVIAIVAVGGGLTLSLVQVVVHAIRDTVRIRHQEVSRREIAAYIAEGAMSPTEGERLMNAGASVSDRRRENRHG